MEKITIGKQYANIIAKCQGVLTKEELAFLEERKALHEKKNANRKETKVQKENEVIKSSILEIMVDNRDYTVSEIQKLVGLETNQKTSALLRQLVLDEKVKRTEVKGKAYFTKA